MSEKQVKYIAPTIALFLIVAGAFTGVAVNRQHQANILDVAVEKKEPRVAFHAELYEVIKKNYWEKVTDEQLSELYKLGVEKVIGNSAMLSTQDLAGVEEMIKTHIDSNEDAAKLGDVVLANLKPFGRSRLFSKEQETALRQQVENINPEKDLYATLGVSKGASIDEIEKAYQANPKTEETTYARNVLANEGTKSNYDKGGQEPTIVGKILKPGISYIHIKQFAPLTISEFKNVSDTLAATKPDMLILDLRGNIGGAVDFLQYFLGPFIGPDQYAYEFFHQGDRTPYRTKTGWLDSFNIYKKVVVLVDGTTQSSAEVMATALKKYRFGILVGSRTKGHGTIEQLIPMSSELDSSRKYSAVLVQSITLRADGQPVEGRGEDPVINTSDKDWVKQLRSYYDNEVFLKAVSDAWINPPK